MGCAMRIFDPFSREARLSRRALMRMLRAPRGKRDIMIRAAQPTDTGAIAAIYNHAVVHTAAIWNEQQVDAANRLAWMQARLALGYPVLVAEQDGAVVGYASFGDFRPFDGYRFSVEHSVYVAPDRHGRGIGRALMQALIPQARALGKHVMIGGIEAQNIASIRLHASLGFVETGRMPQVGCKFGRWLDLVFMQLRLDDRSTPA